MKDEEPGSVASLEKASRRPRKAPAAKSHLPLKLCKALQVHLTSIRKEIIISEDGVLHLADGDASTAQEVVDLAWREGFLRFANNGDLLLLHANRVPFATDMLKVRRRLEENIRTDWGMGAILEVALRVGVPIG